MNIDREQQIEQQMERINALRNAMRRENVQAYLITTEDDHGSEYVSDHFKFREYMSGFTGSNGTLVVLEERAALWTDGRYFLQAEEQLTGTGITLMRQGEEGTPSIPEYIKRYLQRGDILGIDGKCISSVEGNEYREILAEEGIFVRMDLDAATVVWENRPCLPAGPVWELDLIYAGKSRPEKWAALRRKMEMLLGDVYLMTSLCDIAWLLNVRGEDIACTPVPMAYLLVGRSESRLYIEQKGLPKALREKLSEEGIVCRAYETFYEEIKTGTAWEGLQGHSEADSTEKNRVTLLLDREEVNAYLWDLLAEQSVTVHPVNSLTALEKAVKNPVEVENERLAHIKDGVAVTRCIYQLKKWAESETKDRLTELDVAERLEGFRREQKLYVGPSFTPIAAYGPHGAIIHYSPTEESNIALERRGFLLLDTGGHYLEGTTDITRTICLGSLTDEQRERYTDVLRGHLRLAGARFLHGTSGMNLDYLAREPLWEQGLDYRHGTGHGVGYLLSVHEGPNAFRYRLGTDHSSATVLEEGMITSNEPGYYQDGAYGIRLENLLVCKKLEKTTYGQFMGFDSLTLVPFDREAILPERMSTREKDILNEYQENVYDSLCSYLTQEERRWLRRETRPLPYQIKK